MAYTTKLDKIMTERNITVGNLNEILRKKRLPTLDPTAFAKYRKGKVGVSALLNSNPKYPSVLERVCIGLSCHSSEILEY
jgi:DNA-binding Xre family transcriptional regulator